MTLSCPTTCSQLPGRSRSQSGQPVLEANNAGALIAFPPGSTTDELPSKVPTEELKTSIKRGASNGRLANGNEARERAGFGIVWRLFGSCFGLVCGLFQRFFEADFSLRRGTQSGRPPEFEPDPPAFAGWFRGVLSPSFRFAGFGAGRGIRDAVGRIGTCPNLAKGQSCRESLQKNLEVQRNAFVKAMSKSWSPVFAKGAR